MRVISCRSLLDYAGLLAEGVTTIYNVKHIYRGYTDIVKHLKDLGADIGLNKFNYF